MARYHIAIILLVFCVLSPNAKTQDITPKKYDFGNVDLRSEFGPIRAQGDMGFCVAYSNADMLSFWLKKYTSINTVQPANMVSGLGTAIVLNKERRADTLDQIKEAKKIIGNNDPHKVLDNLQNKTTELIEKIDKMDAERTANGINVSMEEYSQARTALIDAQNKEGLVDGLVRLNEPEKEQFIAPKKICFEKDVPTSSDQNIVENPCHSTIQIKELFSEFYGLKISPANKQAVTENIKKLFPKIKAKYINKLIKKFSQEPNFDALKKLTDKSCKSIDSIMSNNYPSAVISRLDYTAGDLLKTIDEKLTAGEPISIGYNAMLYYYYVAEIPDDGVYFPPEKGHQSTIVGRLYDNASGEYVYILRNTWGVGACTCLQKAYALSLPSLRDDVINAFCADPVRSQSKLLSDMAASVYASNKEKYNSEVPFSCDNGYFLIKKSALKQNLYNIAYYLPVKKLPKPEKP